MPSAPVSVNFKERDEFVAKIGTRIQMFRAARKVSLSELARRANIGKGTLSSLEAGNGNPTIMTLAALAAALDVTPSDFMYPDGAAEPHQLEGPTIEMLFVHRYVSASTWEIYETTVPKTEGPVHSALHEGTEHIFMLDGEVLVGPESDPVLLRPGMHTSFSGAEPHLYWAKDGPARMMLTMQYARPANTPAQ